MHAAPHLPSLRALAAELRALHVAWSHPDSGGEYVGLTLAKRAPERTPHGWKVRVIYVSDRGEHQFGREWVPGCVERRCPDMCNNGRAAGGFDGFDEPCVRCNGRGRVHVPSTFDATAAARRLLAAARDAGHR